MTFQKSEDIQSEVILTVSVVDTICELTKGFAATHAFWYNTGTTVTMIYYNKRRSCQLMLT